MSATRKVTSDTPAILHPPWLQIARYAAMVFMAFCVVIFIWGALLFPHYGLSTLDFIRPNANWSDATLLAVIEDAGLSVVFMGYFQFAITLFVALAMVATGLIIFWRKSNSGFGLYVGVLFVVFGTFSNYVATPVGQVLPFLAPIFDMVGTLVWLAFFPLLYLFPDGRFTPTWTRWLLPIWLGVNIGFVFNLFPESLVYTAIPLYLVIGIGSQGFRYFRRSDAVQKQQTKWVFFALGLMVITGILAIANLALSPLGSQLTVTGLWISIVAASSFYLSLAVLPVTIGIAILRYRLWDIDVIIRKTLVYAVLTGILALVYLGAVILLQSVFEAVSGQQSAISIVISTLIIAALFSPLRQRVQTAIDRRFFRQKYDAQRVLAQFALSARDEVELEALTAELERVLRETVQPQSISIWFSKLK